MYAIISLPLLSILLAATNVVTAFEETKDGLTVKSTVAPVECTKEDSYGDSYAYPTYPRDILHADWSTFAENDKSRVWKFSEFGISVCNP